jgi:hypothetical protein
MNMLGTVLVVLTTSQSWQCFCLDGAAGNCTGQVRNVMRVGGLWWFQHAYALLLHKQVDCESMSVAAVCFTRCSGEAVHPKMLKKTNPVLRTASTLGVIFDVSHLVLP